MNISAHITYNEATHSNKAVALGIDNAPNAEQLSNMKLVAEKCFEPLRNWYGKPITINSFFRNEATNKAVGSKNTSDHLKGCAIDLTGGSKAENKKIYDWCVKNLQYDQCINEFDYSWVHISYRASGNRKMAFPITK